MNMEIKKIWALFCLTLNHLLQTFSNVQRSCKLCSKMPSPFHNDLFFILPSSYATRLPPFSNPFSFFGVCIVLSYRNTAVTLVLMTSVIIYSKVNTASMAGCPIIHIFPTAIESSVHVEIYYADYISQTPLQLV